MKNLKLANILRTFSKSEIKELEKFITSAYFNKGRNYTLLLNELKKFHPKFDDDKMTPEFIYSGIYPGKKFNKQIVWNQFSGLLNLTEEFLIQKALAGNRLYKKLMLAEEYHGRKLTRYLAKTTDEMEEKLDDAGIDDNYFSSKIQIEILRKAYNFLEDTQHLIPKHIARQGEFTILNFLRTASGVINDMDSNLRMFNAHFDFNLSHVFIKNLNLEEIIKYAKEKNFRYWWILEMYYHSIKMNTEQDSLGNFLQLKKLYKEHSAKFARAEKNTWLTLLANYCAGHTGFDEAYLRKELFEINKLTLRDDALPDERYFFKIKFMQILRNALIINETNWAKNFIEKFVPKLKPTYQKSMKALGLAYLNFYLGNFDAVLDNLKNVKFIDSRDKLNVKNLYIRTYYELNEIEAVISQIDTAKHFLNSNPAFTSKTKSNYIKSLNLLSRLINANLNHNTAEIEAIQKTAEENRGLIFGKWILEKIEQIKN